MNQVVNHRAEFFPLAKSRSVRCTLIVATMAAAFVTACGGGGNDADEPCSSATGLSLGMSWVSNGVPTGNHVIGKVGQPLAADPLITGLPASCSGKVGFSLGINTLPSGPSALPPGLSLDSHTGRISGTPTQAFGISGPDFLVQAQGYKPAKFIFNIWIAP